MQRSVKPFCVAIFSREKTYSRMSKIESFILNNSSLMVSLKLKGTQLGVTYASEHL